MLENHLQGTYIKWQMKSRLCVTRIECAKKFNVANWRWTLQSISNLCMRDREYIYKRGRHNVQFEAEHIKFSP